MCDENMVCVFKKTDARVLDPDGDVVGCLERDGSLFNDIMKLRRLEARNAGSFLGWSDS